MDQELKRLFPQEMTREQARRAAIREELTREQDRLFSLRQEYEDVREDLDGKRYLDGDLRETVYTQYREKIEASSQEVHDLTLALEAAS